MTPEQQAYELWGERWKSVLASMEGVNKRTVQRWASDAAPQVMPTHVQSKIDITYRLWRSQEF